MSRSNVLGDWLTIGVGAFATFLIARFALATLPIIMVGGVVAYLLATNTAERKPIKIRNRKDRP